MKTIVVNATALDTSGALTVLRQFVSAVPDDGIRYLLFVSPRVRIATEKQNVFFIKMPVKSFFRRFYWDAWGIRKWLRKHGVVPAASLSLQNTNFRTKERISNYVYFHQSIPFYRRRWNPFRKEERSLWFYRNVYPFFVKLFLNAETEVFVQTQSVKKDFKCCFAFPEEKIHVVFPDLSLSADREISRIGLDPSYVHLFYPATPFLYKNHAVLFDALHLLEPVYKKRIILHLTCHENEIKNLQPAVRSGLCIDYLGQIPFGQVLGMYREADLLVFPSYIETIGLPLLEAAFYGTGILAADRPYAREVLDGYAGVRFVDPYDAAGWAFYFRSAVDNRCRYPGFTYKRQNSWNDLFTILKSKL